MPIDAILMAEFNNGNLVRNTFLFVEFINTLKIFTTCHKLNFGLLVQRYWQIVFHPKMQLSAYPSCPHRGSLLL